MGGRREEESKQLRKGGYGGVKCGQWLWDLIMKGNKLKALKSLGMMSF